MGKYWAIAVMVIAVCITTYQLAVDPRIKAMQSCTRGFPDSSKQVACAKAIFGFEADK